MPKKNSVSMLKKPKKKEMRGKQKFIEIVPINQSFVVLFSSLTIYAIYYYGKYCIVSLLYAIKSVKLKSNPLN